MTRIRTSLHTIRSGVGSNLFENLQGVPNGNGRSRVNQDLVPGADPLNLTAIAGIFVGIRREDTGTYLLIAHVMPASVFVEAGDVVEEGQVLGRCGNSGNTSELHIHNHHQRQGPAVFPVNFAEGLRLYFRDPERPPMPQGGVQEGAGSQIAAGDTVQHTGR